jgi:hypothetical protein
MSESFKVLESSAIISVSTLQIAILDVAEN